MGLFNNKNKQAELSFLFTKEIDSSYAEIKHIKAELYDAKDLSQDSRYVKSRLEEIEYLTNSMKILEAVRKVLKEGGV